MQVNFYKAHAFIKNVPFMLKEYTRDLKEHIKLFYFKLNYLNSDNNNSNLAQQM